LSTQPSLFADAREVRIQRIDQEILNLLTGIAGGPLGLRLTDDEREVLTMIRYHRGAASAIKLADIQQRTRLNVRTIKDAVRTLRMNFHLPLGSSKHAETGGYFLMISSEDRAIWRKDVLDQARAQLAVLHACDGRQAALEALGQLRAELESREESHA
jgi:hypothetical protein